MFRKVFSAPLIVLSFMAVLPFYSPLAHTQAAPTPDQPAAVQEGHPKKIKPVKQNQPDDKPLPADMVQNPVLWQQPANIASLNLFYGQGGESHQPKPPFTFLVEDLHGTNPKFDARDADDKKWRVKLGEESRPEVAASRLLWAMGYYVQDDYLLKQADVSNLSLKRGSNLVQNGHITNARFARKPGGEKKIAVWKWKENPFNGTREFNGLRVMMAVMNNWDLKDVNNSVFSDDKNDRQIFLVSDIGATFATNTLTNSRAKDKGNPDEFEKSKFIIRKTKSEVDFGTPAPPTGVLIQGVGFTAGEYMHRRGFDWIGHNIPRDDVRWMASLLAQLSHQQIVDAFRAANFPQDQADIYVKVVESRIHELKEL